MQAGLPHPLQPPQAMEWASSLRLHLQSEKVQNDWVCRKKLSYNQGSECSLSPRDQKEVTLWLNPYFSPQDDPPCSARPGLDQADSPGCLSPRLADSQARCPLCPPLLNIPVTLNSGQKGNFRSR